MEYNSRPKVVVFTGAGISRESGLKTFRDEDGLWEGHSVNDVCTVEAWEKQPKIVLDFYNARRREVSAAEPNEAHKALVELQNALDVAVVTQNIDDLHERAGSNSIFHLHGEIMKKRKATGDELYLCAGDIALNEEQFRPHVVYFGEGLYNFESAMKLSKEADVLLVVGTTLAVYPAALIATKSKARQVWVVDPQPPSPRNFNRYRQTLNYIHKPASEGVPQAVEEIIKHCQLSFQ